MMLTRENGEDSELGLIFSTFPRITLPVFPVNWTVQPISNARFASLLS